MFLSCCSGRKLSNTICRCLIQVRLRSDPLASCRLDLAEIFLEAGVWQCGMDFTLFNSHLDENIWLLDNGVLNSQCRMCQGVSWDRFESIAPLRPRGVFSKSFKWKTDGLQLLFVLKWDTEMKNIFDVLIANKSLAINKSFLCNLISK